MIAAVIPTRFRPPALGALLRALAADGVRPLVMDSDAFAHRIYAMWNAGAGMARAGGAEFTAFLSDDCALPAGALALMARALADPSVGVVYPDVRAPWGAVPAEPALERTEGTWGSGGMTGFCFMVRSADALPPFDEGYGWWYGDDAFEEAVRRQGLAVARVAGLPVLHEPNGSAAQVWAELAPLVEADRARWEGRAAA